MCGFIVCLSSGLEKEGLTLKEVERSLELLNHRGPDESKVIRTESGHFFGHTRLSIVSPEKGTQPISHNKKTWVHNGEIYNHKEIKALADSPPFEQSDSAAIGVAYDLYGVSFLNKLDGVFALAMEVLEEDGSTSILVARDPLGVKPLFYGKDTEGNYCFASEMKALADICTEISIFPPGTVFTSNEGFREYYKPHYKSEDVDFFRKKEEVMTLISSGLQKAVEKRLMGDVEIGALLSGGLDSSLVAALAARKLKAEGRILKTFSVGLESSTIDLEKAQLVADHIGSEHHSITYTVKEGIETLREMIRLLESYEVTTIRASTPMFIISKYIRSLGVKSVLSGEGADEMFGGYLYFAHAPTSKDFHDECLKRVGGLHQADLLRADRSTMGASVEARVPFLDLEFLELVMKIDPELKTISQDRAEKWILRESFKESGLLPEEVLWRQKEQFSDGVGYEWVDGLKELAQKVVTDIEFENANEVFAFNTPTTKEAFLYRKIFTEIFTHPDVEKQTVKWIPRWQDYNTDPSGRANKVHDQSTEIKLSRSVTCSNREEVNIKASARLLVGK